MPMSSEALPTLPPPIMMMGAIVVARAMMVVAMVEALNLKVGIVKLIYSPLHQALPECRAPPGFTCRLCGVPK